MPSSHILLRAGPIRLKFADGELRYLCVGAREIARRLHFVVRDHHWDTAMPRFTRMDVQQTQQSFVIELEARCVVLTVDFSWKATITGSAEGAITFAVSGEPMRDFQSNRIGLCLLFGAQSLAGHPFELLNSKGRNERGEFSRLVSPELLGENFTEIRYRTDVDLHFSASVEGAAFSMEDQRNYADTSYKAYAPLPYAYPAAPAGARLAQTVRLAVTGAGGSALQNSASSDAQPETRIRLGGVVEGARIPKVSRSTLGTPEIDFYAINTQRHLHLHAATIRFACNPGLHLPDDDTFMENVPAVVDQVRTVRSFAPGAKIRIDPITFNSPHPRLEIDPRNLSAFGAAWSVAILKHLALTGVDEAGFAVSGEVARAVQEDIGACVGCRVLLAESEAIVRPPVEVLAVESKESIRLWLMNMTDSPRSAVIVHHENHSLLATCHLDPYAVLARELLPPST